MEISTGKVLQVTNIGVFVLNKIQTEDIVDNKLSSLLKFYIERPLMLHAATFLVSSCIALIMGIRVYIPKIWAL